MKVAAVIPARMQSTRLPGKPLIRLGGIPIILRVLNRIKACEGISRVIVATDSEEVRAEVERNGGDARITSPHHSSGSDRIAEVARNLTEEYILNVQGDEPFMPKSTVATVMHYAKTHPFQTVVTAMFPLLNAVDIRNPHIVKIVASKSGKAMYFSRYGVPFDQRSNKGVDERVRPEGLYFKHIGIYLYRREFLLKFVEFKQTRLECSERLEQLRILENDYPIYVVQVPDDSLGIDTPEDLIKAECLLAGSDTTTSL